MPVADSALLSTTYLAPVQYYCKLAGYKNVWVDIFENYSKQSFRNRCVILGANGPLTLSIPVKKNNLPKTLTRDVNIDYDTRWQSVHWRAIESSYRSSPFFIYYVDNIEPFFAKKIKFLVDFNTQLQETILNLLGLQPEIKFTKEYIVKTEGFDDYRESIHPKPRMYQKDDYFAPHPYYQVFGNKFGFVANLSIVDLLFNMGPSAVDELKASTAF
jgi:hypothetical protein